MGDVNPEGIISSIGEKNLAFLADFAKIKVPEKKRGKGSVDVDKLVELLVKYVQKEGTNRVLSVLKLPRLKKLIVQPDLLALLESQWTPPPKKPVTPKKDDKKAKGGKEKGGKGKKKGKKKEEEEKDDRQYPKKAQMISIIAEYLEKNGWKDLLESLDDKILLGLCGDIDDLTSYEDDEKEAFTKDEMVNAILTNVSTFGLNHLFSYLNVDELQSVCKDMKLKVDSGSQEVLIDSIIEKKSYKRTVKKTKKVREIYFAHLINQLCEEHKDKFHFDQKKR